MPRDLTSDQARDALRSRARLLDLGVSPSDLRRAGGAGPVHRIQRGVYVDREVVTDLRPHALHRLAVVAAVSCLRGSSAVVSHASAAVLHDLPQYLFGRRPVEMTVPNGVRISSRPGLRRHLDRLSEDDVVVVDGIRCTSLDRTVFDLARTSTMDAALTCADAAARREAVNGRRFDERAQERWRDRLRERAGAAKGRRGVGRARWLIEFADGRAESPGESVSRLQFFRLGFRGIELQVPVAGPHGRDYIVDIGLPEAKTFWEFDGEVKYTDPQFRGGRAVEEVLLAEKRREDWIRGVTQWRVCRGGFSDIVEPVVLARRLRAFGVHLPD